MAARLTFAGFELDLVAYTLRHHARPIRLEKLPMELLILLARRAGAMVSRDEIRVALWGDDVHVEHGPAINTAIRKLRQALGDDAEQPRIVETVVGKGYRFVARVDDERPVGVTRPATCFLTRGAQRFDLAVGETVLGRDPAVAVCVDHPSVSRRHACISIDADGVVLRDLGSRNGTFVDGRRIDGLVPLDHGAVIGIGPIAFTLTVRGAPDSTQAMAPER